MAASPSDVLKLGQQNGAQFVDIRFSDLPGLMQHFSVPFEEFGEEVFEEGLGFDGSSIRGFQEIQESDMILVPDFTTATAVPWTAEAPPTRDDLLRDAAQDLDGERRARLVRYRSANLHCDLLVESGRKCILPP